MTKLSSPLERLSAQLRNGLQTVDAENEAPWIVEYCEKHFGPDPNLVETEALKILVRRQAHEPLAYIFGSWPFLDFEFFVGPGVLIPRPETEELADRILSEIDISGLDAYTVADLGAGSGCLGLSVAAKLSTRPHKSALPPRITLYLVERSGPARKWLKKNIDLFPKADFPNLNIELVESDWLAWNESYAGKLDLFLSNPPYVSKSEFKGLDPGVKDFEPLSALVPDRESSEDSVINPYVELVHIAEQKLAPGGIFYFELGSTQAETLVDYLGAKSIFRDLRLIEDLAGKKRFLSAKLRHG